MTPIQIQPSTPDSLGSGLPPEQVIAAIFRDPATGADIPVRIRLFQLGFGTQGFGAGVYMAGADGEPRRGTVLRWDNGPESEPTVIQWQAPHCADDKCGSPCGHGDAS